jgi:hypothetical protein
MQSILIVLILLAAFISSVLFSFMITGNISNDVNITATIFQKQSGSSNIKDSKGDTKLVALYKTNILPEVKNYHDILSAYVNQINNNKIQLTIDLAGDANQNEKYETVYLWLIYYTAYVAAGDSSTGDRRDQLYTVIVPNFGAKSNFGNIEKGWYLAIFNNTDISYTLPLSKISDMPKDKVQVFIDPAFIGNPSSSFNYIVSAMIRVNSTFLDKPPDYIVDSVPNNYNSFWKRWFRLL